MRVDIVSGEIGATDGTLGIWLVKIWAYQRDRVGLTLGSEALWETSTQEDKRYFVFEFGREWMLTFDRLP